MRNPRTVLAILTAFFIETSTFIALGASPWSNVEPERFGQIVGRIYNLLYPIAIIYGIFEIVLAGYKIMSSEGEPKKMSEAKEHLTGSIIGIIFVILAVVILRVIINSFLGPVTLEE